VRRTWTQWDERKNGDEEDETNRPLSAKLRVEEGGRSRLALLPIVRERSTNPFEVLLILLRLLLLLFLVCDERQGQ
jgi:hypothetical protein